MSFNDVVAAQGRNEAGRIIRGRIDEVDVSITSKRRQEDAATEAMKAAVSRERTREIKEFFSERLFEFADHLSVRVDTTKTPSMTSMPFGRGSEGPRGIIAYYYAFLHTVRKYSSSAFCPIVIDAPNQQGQDDMQRVMRFIIDKRPPDSQGDCGYRGPVRSNRQRCNHRECRQAQEPAARSRLVRRGVRRCKALSWTTDLGDQSCPE